MASATGIPAQVPGVTDEVLDRPESEPLLGRPGDALQKPEESIIYNLTKGRSLTPISITNPSPPPSPSR